MQKSYKMGGLGTHISLKSGVYDGKIAGLYDLEETLGRGHFAVVKLARHVFTGEKVAVKVIDKSKLDSVSKAHLFQEVRCMKLVQHPNVVRLYEVIDTATKLYLILELGDGGDLYDYIMRHEAGLNESVARDYFAQIVRAITYCHQLHVVHRDLKPENVVFFEKQGVVKLTDFGFSNKFSPGQKLETSCGSLAYSAPEILLGDSYDAPAVDVWSLGVILYMLVCGQAPFHEANDSETLTMIMDCKYTVPIHISQECKDLIARMLVRAPEKRATLPEISAHPWFARNRIESIDILPLVSREQLTEDDHNLIVSKMVNGNIATKEEIQECLDKNDYNHITATYFLLAERKLRFKRQEQTSKGKRPENLAVPNNNSQVANNKLLIPTPCLLSVPRTPGDVPQRSRKCSIVQEDEEEEDISSSGREELNSGHNSLNRRGSRSEGRINIALQERLAESERRKVEENPPRVKAICNIKTLESRPRSAHEAVTDVKVKATYQLAAAPPASKWKVEKSTSIPEANVHIPTTIIMESSTISVPISQNVPITSPIPKYKTIPSPTRPLSVQLNEIFEEGDCTGRSTNRQMVNRSRYTSSEHRRTKFHKTRTASCSSSDASDDDSENRKKRAHKLNPNTSAKPLQPRRDSHDDSSDSQEPGAGAAGTTTGNGTHATGFAVQSNTNNSNNNKTSNANENNTGGRKHTTNTSNGAMLGRRHKASRRRSSETRLRESQSLNRITEEQDGGSANIIVTATISSAPAVKTKSFGAKFLGFTMGGSKRPASEHYSRKDTKAAVEEPKLPDFREEKENKLTSSKKMRLLGRYFQVHKRIFMPIPNLFSRNKLYKARSCGSLARDKISSTPEEVEALRQRAVSVIRNSVGSTSDINQNMGTLGTKTDESANNTTTAGTGPNSNLVLVKNVTAGLTNMCAHLGPASKCSFC